MEITAQNVIYLGEETGGKGRQFKARFLVPGLVKYDYGVCLLTKENADKFMQGFIGCPVVINHQDVTDDNVKDIAVGDIFSVWFDDKDGYYWCNGIIRDKEAIKLINEGYSVSCQYLITEYSDNTAGALHNGNPYDKVIENGKPEHLAIVNNPRYEGAIIAVNSKDKEEKKPFVEQFKDTLYTVLAEGIYNRLLAVNGWVTLDRIDEETGERVKIFIGGDEAATYHSKWFDEDIDEFKKSKEMKIKLDSLHDEVKNTILNTVKDINKQFKIKDLVSVSTGPLQRAYAFNLTDMEHNAIRVSKKKFENLEQLKKSFDSDCDALFHPKGLKDTDPVKAIIMHELGHSITVAGGTSEFWNEIDTIRTKHNKELGVSSYKTFKRGKGKYNTQNMISGYALYNRYEFVAEGFADAMLSKNPCKYSKDVLKCIEKHFEITGQKQKQLRLFNAIMEAVNAMSNEKKKNEETKKDNLFLENFGLGYPTQEEFDKWIEEQEED